MTGAQQVTRKFSMGIVSKSLGHSLKGPEKPLKTLLKSDMKRFRIFIRCLVFFQNLILLDQELKKNSKIPLKVPKCPKLKEKLGQSFIVSEGIVLDFLAIYLTL